MVDSVRTRYRAQAGRSTALVLGSLLAFVIACGSEGGGDASGAGGNETLSSGGGPAGEELGASSGGAGSGSPGGGTGSVSCGLDIDTGAGVLRRLSALEYQLTVQDLLALGEPASAEGLPLDTERLGFRTYADLQTMSAENLRGYFRSAESLAAALFEDPARRAKVVGCDVSETGCLESFVRSFGRRAYRRSLEAAEVSSLVQAARAAALDEADAFKLVIEVFLTSPSFLYRVEVGSEKEGLSTLSPTELASKLSFALHGRGPSAELLDLAESGALDTEEGLARVAEDMLADPRAQTFFASFFRQWLGYQTLKPMTPADEPVYRDMQLETDRLIEEYAFGNQDFLNVLTANHTFLTPRLATFYGLPAPSSDGRLEFPEESPRARSGLLTHASLLSAKGDGDLISIRGNWLRKTFLCESLELPPDLQDTIGEILVGLDRIAIFQARNTLGDCAGCHAKIDPIGLGLFVFDRRGVFDPTVDLTPYEMKPAFPDAPAPNSFERIAELSASLAKMPEVPSCIADRAFLYVHGREPNASDVCAVQRIASEFKTTGHAFRSLIGAVVKGPEFRLRRAPAVSP